MPYAFLALIAALGLLLLIPARRLFLAGWSRRAIAVYWVAMVALGLVVAELRAPARFLVPIMVVAYIAPFVTARAGMSRLFGRDATGRDAVIVRTVEPSLLSSGAATESPADGSEVAEEPADAQPAADAKATADGKPGADANATARAEATADAEPPDAEASTDVETSGRADGT